MVIVSHRHIPRRLCSDHGCSVLRRNICLRPLIGNGRATCASGGTSAAAGG